MKVHISPAWISPSMAAWRRSNPGAVGGWPQSHAADLIKLRVPPVPRLWGPGKRTYRVIGSESIWTTGRRAIIHSDSLPTGPLLFLASSIEKWPKINWIQWFCCPRSPKARDRGTLILRKPSLSQRFSVDAKSPSHSASTPVHPSGQELTFGSGPGRLVNSGRFAVRQT